MNNFLDNSSYLSRGFEAQSHTLVVAGELFLDLLATISDQNTLLVLEDGGLFLIGPLGLWNKKIKKLRACKLTSPSSYTFYTGKTRFEYTSRPR